MKIIGLTGGIGSGKSTIKRIFETLGVPTYDADTHAKEIVNTNDIVKAELKKMFGDDIYIAKNQLDNVKLGKRIFNDRSLLKEVNNLIHPEVINDFREWVGNQDSPYVIKEAAILFESGAYKRADLIITIVAPVDLRIERIYKRDGISREHIKRIIDNQMSDEEKIKLSKYVIYNDNSTLITPQILKIHKELSNN